MRDVTRTEGKGSVWLGGLLGMLVVAGSIWLFEGGAQTIGLQVMTWQREFHRALIVMIDELAGAPSMTAWSTLLGISFAIVTLLGLWLCWRTVRQLRRRATVTRQDPGHDHHIDPQ